MLLYKSLYWYNLHSKCIKRCYWQVLKWGSIFNTGSIDKCLTQTFDWHEELSGKVHHCKWWVSTKGSESLVCLEKCDRKKRWESDCKNISNVILLRFRLLKISVIKTSHFLFTIYLNNYIWSVSQKKTSWVYLGINVDAKVLLNLPCLREPAHFVPSMLPILMRYKVFPPK